MQEQYRAGIQYLEAATTLLHRVRSLHPTAGLLDAADLHWWWRAPRSTDSVPQLFWFDHAGRPEAAALVTDWGDGIVLDPIVMPNAAPDRVAHVIERGLAHAGVLGSVDVVIDSADHVMREVLIGHGFSDEQHDKLNVADAWLTVGAPTPVSPLHKDYRLCSRLDTLGRPHHMIGRNGPELEARLRQTSLYRPELDLLVLDAGNRVAAYGVFWFDPVTAAGLVEPMRTENDHQRRGLARHILTAGIDLLAQAGAERIKVCFKLTNAAAKELYLSVGFKPDKQTAVLSRKGSCRPAQREIHVPRPLSEQW
jgi:ribosomal protein S18 acetylase RimI-like enzyme